MYRYGLILVVAAFLVAALIGCGNSEPVTTIQAPAIANNITENMLLALNNSDYPAYIKDFRTDDKGAPTEDIFKSLVKFYTPRIGQYKANSKVATKIEEKTAATEITYMTEFSDEPDGVTVTIQIITTDNGTFTTGIWFNSPKLFLQAVN
jgi:hypothetical protein